MAEEKQGTAAGQEEQQPQEAQKQEETQQKPEEKQADNKNRFAINPGPVTMETGIPGLLFDFNLGLRVKMPEGESLRVRGIDLDTDYPVFDVPAVEQGKTVASGKLFFTRWRVEVYRGADLIFSHDYDASGKDVLIDLCSSAMGDTLAFIPYVREFKQLHGCKKVYCRAEQYMIDLLRPSYPDIDFVGRGEHPEGIYATYYVGNFYPSTDRRYQPYTWHLTGLQGCAYTILGLEEKEIRPELAVTKEEREIKEPYVCIAAQGSAICKQWNNPIGWMDTIKFLKEAGYRVLCIDKERCTGFGDRWNTIPYGAEDFTGNIPLQERVNLLHHADFFIGLGSGLSWLAWATGIPVVMICGFSSPHFEFSTPYRIINRNVCNSCFNDGQQDFDVSRLDWCPKHQDDPNARFQCTRAITPGHVIRTIKKLMENHHLEPRKSGQ